MKRILTLALTLCLLAAALASCKGREKVNLSGMTRSGAGQSTAMWRRSPPPWTPAQSTATSATSS